MLLVVVLAVAYWKQIVERLRYIVIGAGVTVGSFIVLAAYQLRTLLFGAQSLVHSHALLHPRNVLVTDLYGFVVPSSYSAVAPSSLERISMHFGATHGHERRMRTEAEGFCM